jgi:hypothetical protein
MKLLRIGRKKKRIEIVERIKLYGKLCQEINWLAWRRFNVGRCRKKPEIDAEILWDFIEKNLCRWMQTEVLRC